MSIGRRFWNLARSELNALQDKAKGLGDVFGGDNDDTKDDDGLAAFSERELEEELAGRRLQKEIDERARQAEAARSKARAQAESPRGGNPGSTRSAGGPVGGVSPAAIKKAYAALDVAPGAEIDEVKSAYRKLMRKYHPDRHAGSPEKQKAAHNVSLKLTEAYETLKKHLGRG